MSVRRKGLSRILALILGFLLIAQFPTQIARAADVLSMEYLGHSAFVLTYGASKVLIDPWAPGNMGLPYYLPFSVADGISVMTASHDHGDHFYPPAVPGGTPTILGASSAGGFTPLAGPQVFGSLTITSVGTKHFPDSAGPDNAAFIYDLPGIRVVHLGDAFGSLAAGLDAATVTALTSTPIDVLMIPVGGADGVSAVPFGQLQAAISALNPKVVIPIHPWATKADFIASGTAVYGAPVTTGPVAAYADPGTGSPVIWDMQPSVVAGGQVTAVSPAFGDTGAPVALTISGIGFGAGATVQLVDPAAGGHTDLAVGTVSATEVTATVPADAAVGSYLLYVSNVPTPPTRSAVAAGTFQVTEPAPPPPPPDPVPVFTGITVAGPDVTMLFSEAVTSTLTTADVSVTVGGAPVVPQAVTQAAAGPAVTVTLPEAPAGRVAVTLLNGGKVADSSLQPAANGTTCYWPAPTLVADVTENTVGQDIDITFADDADWRSAVTAVSLNASAIPSDAQVAGGYTLTAGNLHIPAAYLGSSGDYVVKVTVTGYPDATVTQSIAAAATKVTGTASVGDNTVTMASMTTVAPSDNTFTVDVTGGLTVKSGALVQDTDYSITGLPAGLSVTAAGDQVTGKIVFMIGGTASADVTEDAAISVTLLASAVDPAASLASGAIGGITLRHWVPAPTVSPTVTVDGSPAPGVTVNSSWDAGQKLLNVQLQTGAGPEASYELNTLFTADTVFTLTIADNGLTPYVAIGAGDFQEWSTQGGTTTIKVKGVHFTPDATLDIGLGVMIAVQYDPDPAMLPATYRGMTISTNGNVFAPPQIDAATGKFSMLVGGQDGVLDGFFKALLPTALLADWGVDTPEQLKTSIDRTTFPQTTVTADAVAGTMTLRFDMHFSTHTVYIDALSPAPALTADSTENRVGTAIEVTFVDDAAWEAAITSISIDGTVISRDSFAAQGITVASGRLTLASSLFSAAATYQLKVTANGYGDASVAQVVEAAAVVEPPAPPVAPPPVVSPPPVTTDDDQTSESPTGTTTTTISDTGTAAVVEVVDEAKVDLGSLSDGLTIDLSKDSVTVGGSGSQAAEVTQRAAEIPVTLLQTLAEREVNVVLETGVATLEIPPTALTGLDAVRGVGTGETAAKQVRISVETVDPTAATAGGGTQETATVLAVREALNGVEARGLTPAGRVLAFSAEVLQADGQSTSVSQFSQPLTVSIPFGEAQNPSHLGVYRLNRTTGEWEYRGGRVDLERHCVVVELTGFSEYVVMEYDKTFADVPAGHWAKEDIELLASRHVVNGGDTDYAPGDAVTRAEFAAMLGRALGLALDDSSAPTFNDVAATDWFRGAVVAAAKAGLVTGNADAFRPRAAISRQEIAVILSRALALRRHQAALGDTDAAALLAGYSDDKAIAAWARGAAAESTKLGLIKGRAAGAFSPAETASRAEVATVIARLLRLLGEL